MEAAVAGHHPLVADVLIVKKSCPVLLGRFRSFRALG